ncbi:hypothetical protein EJ110_NYTH29520 [Nymphaea thermarum]|nr:hypothetical protein EJ110_NYTH29520 [Nymphaea thermarum]
MEGEGQRPLLNDHHRDGGSHGNRSGMVEFEGDSEPTINSAERFLFQFGVESKKLWHLAGHAIFTILSRYSLRAVTQAIRLLANYTNLDGRLWMSEIICQLPMSRTELALHETTSLQKRNYGDELRDLWIPSANQNSVI